MTREDPDRNPDRNPKAVVTEVAPSVLRVVVPLPFAPREVSAWLLRDGEGWTLVDTGTATDAARATWEEVFATALGGRPIRQVVVTHFHPDHVGLAGWICARWRAPLLMTRRELRRTRLLLSEDRDAALAETVAFYRRLGTTPEHLAFVRRRGMPYQEVVTALPETVGTLAEGDALPVAGARWDVMIGAGHAPEMACLWNPGISALISADHILPRISPYVGVGPGEPDADPLGTYLAELEKFRVLPADALVLPSHGEPFRGPHARIAELVAHHRGRLDLLTREAATAGGDGLTVHAAAMVLFPRPLDSHALGFALSETLAHLRTLARRGVLVEAEDGEGRLRFARGGR